jgi:hypothetical protein
MIVTKLSVSYFSLSVDFLLTDAVARFSREVANCSIRCLFKDQSAQNFPLIATESTNDQEEPGDQENAGNECDRNEAELIIRQTPRFERSPESQDSTEDAAV